MKTKTKYWLDPSSECRNCGYEMPEQANYCPSCSQRNTTGKINVFDFLKEALSNLFNIDTKFFRTLYSFVFPGRLTNEFFKGKHQSFASPIRLFFVTVVFFLAALSWAVQDYVMDADPMGIEASKTKYMILDSVEVYHNNILAKINGEEERAAIDSFYQKIVSELETDTSGVLDGNLFNDSISIRWIDVQKLSAEEIIEKYEIDGFLHQLFVKQILKFNQAPSAFLGSMIGNLTLMFLILIPSLAWVFKVLYIRGNWYYVEHLVFLFHYHSFSFLMGAIGLLSHKYMPIWLMGTLVTFVGLYLILSMKNVYQQGWIKTILKYFTIGFSYMIVFTFCIGLIMFMSFLLF